MQFSIYLTCNDSYVDNHIGRRPGDPSQTRCTFSSENPHLSTQEKKTEIRVYEKKYITHTDQTIIRPERRLGILSAQILRLN